MGGQTFGQHQSFPNWNQRVSSTFEIQKTFGKLSNKSSKYVWLCRTGYEKGDTQWGRDQGWRVVRAEECWHKSLNPLMTEVRKQIGSDTPVYLSFDIDSIDPSACPGTGTPEIGGLTTAQALEVVRGCKGLNLVISSI